MKTKNSTVFVSRTIGPKGSPQEGDEDILAIHKFETEPAFVTAEYALTMNLGNYESAKVSVSVTIPCYKEEIDEAHKFASAWVQQRLTKERDMVNEKRNGGGSSPL